MRLKQFRSVIAAFFSILLASGAAYSNQELDRYGGTTSVACPTGAQPHFYTQKIGDRWWLCDPAGHGFFMKGVTVINYDVDSELTTKVESKYGSAYNP